MKGLTDRQRETLEFIKDYIEERSYPPTIREIGDGIGVSSTSTVVSHLHALQRKGYLVNDGDRNQPRMLRVVEGGGS